MTRLSKLPGMNIEERHYNDEMAFFVKWYEIHPVRAKKWKALTAWALSFFPMMIVYGSWYFWLWGRLGLPTVLDFGIPFLIGVGLSAWIEDYFFRDWQGCIQGSLKGFSGWKWRRLVGCAYAEPIDGKLRVTFDARVTSISIISLLRGGASRYKPEYSRLETPLYEIRGFSITTERDYLGSQFIGQNAPACDMILVDLGPRGAFPICMHFANRDAVTALHAKLMNVFVLDRPPEIGSGLADDPV